MPAEPRAVGPTAGRGPGLRLAVAVLGAAIIAPVTAGAAGAQPGLTAADTVARAYDTILDADFDAVPATLARTCPPAPEVACLGLRALATWWAIQLDPLDRARDARFSTEVSAALTAAEAWTAREPARAEAWFYLGAALGARGQWRILRGERLSAARDGKRIKEALDEALRLDPTMADAAFGIGVYRYYAAMAPALFRWMRWLLALPGGDRAGGLAMMERARREGRLVRDEAAYQLHLAYLWYERRFDDALALIRELQARHPRNPLFPHLEAQVLDVYFDDSAGSLAVSEALAARARASAVHEAANALVRAELNIAVQLDARGDRAAARARLAALLDTKPTAPVDAVRRARQLQRAWARR